MPDPEKENAVRDIPAEASANQAPELVAAAKKRKSASVPHSGGGGGHSGGGGGHSGGGGGHTGRRR